MARKISAPRINDKVEFDAETHTYWWNGKYVFGVNQVLTAAGIQDYSGVPRHYADRGTAVHALLEKFDLGLIKKGQDGDDLAGFLTAWVKFRKDHPALEFTDVEKVVFSKKHMVAGRCDRINAEKRVILDIKTGTPQRWAGLQLAGYALCLGGDDWTRIVVRVKEDGTYEVKTFEGADDQRVFLSALTVAKWRKGIC